MLTEACETNEAVENFLKDVDDQISCKIGLSEVNAELRGHIEDKAELYMEYGLEEKEAYRRSIRDMGAADVVGLELNRQHRLRTAMPLLAVILALCVLGLAGEVLRNGLEVSLFGVIWAVREYFYFAWGLLVLFLVTRFGYPILLKHTKTVCVAFLSALLLLGVLYFFREVILDWVEEIYTLDTSLVIFPYQVIGRLFNSVVYSAVLKLAVPVGAVILYRRRNQFVRALVFLFCYQAAGIALAKGTFFGERTFLPLLILFCGCLGTVCYLLAKGWTNAPKVRGTAAAQAGFCVLLLCWAVTQWGMIKENLQLFLYPEAQASVTSAWDDSYNNVLMRDLLDRVRPFGEIQLSKEELIRYGTSQWYYEDGEGKWGGTDLNEDEKDFKEYVEYRMQFLKEPELRQILPQYYMENYRISWWALRYGWVAALALTILVLALPSVAMWTAFRIRSRLGQLTAFSASLVFCLQTVFYLTENLGFQFGAFVDLPFVSEGKISITVSAVLAGLILSAYRYDVVLSEKTAISSDSGRSADRRKRIPV